MVDLSNGRGIIVGRINNHRRNMTEHILAEHLSDRRSEPRGQSNKFHSVEMKLASLPIYLFKLKDISSNGACFFVKEGSAILKHLNVGEIHNFRYHAEGEIGSSEIFKSEIKYITKSLEMPFKGHYLVGIKIIEKLNQVDSQDNLP